MKKAIKQQGKAPPSQIFSKYEHAWVFDGKPHEDNEPIVNDDSNDYDSSNLMPPSELAQAMNDLNRDEKEEHHNMTTIDQRARLAYVEHVYLTILDFLVAVNFIPIDVLRLTQQKKRLSISIDGKGRAEQVAIAQGQREHTGKMGVLQKVKNMVKPDKQ